jgi:hypothetical protein
LEESQVNVYGGGIGIPGREPTAPDSRRGERHQVHLSSDAIVCSRTEGDGRKIGGHQIVQVAQVVHIVQVSPVATQRVVRQAAGSPFARFGNNGGNLEVAAMIRRTVDG